MLVSGCRSIQNQTKDTKDYRQLAEQLKQCDEIIDQSLIEICRTNITGPLSDEEKEKLVDELQAMNYYPDL